MIANKTTYINSNAHRTYTINIEFKSLLTLIPFLQVLFNLCRRILYWYIIDGVHMYHGNIQVPRCLGKMRWNENGLNSYSISTTEKYHILQAYSDVEQSSYDNEFIIIIIMDTSSWYCASSAWCVLNDFFRHLLDTSYLIQAFNPSINICCLIVCFTQSSL